jgi:hypothetical protein
MTVLSDLLHRGFKMYMAYSPTARYRMRGTNDPANIASIPTIVREDEIIHDTASGDLYYCIIENNTRRVFRGRIVEEEILSTDCG